LIEKIKINFNRKVGYKNNKSYSYHAILQDNVQQLANFIVDKKIKSDTLFSIPPFKLERNDEQEFRERILSMLPSERKKLAINKPTLWYMKKNIKSGKAVKIYDKVYERLSAPIQQKGAGK
jgi:hypothetical protein